MSRSALGLAFRIGVELVAAMIVGLGGGLLLDRWLGTAPWGLVGMFFLGAAAGIMNVYRTVNGIGMAPGYRRQPDETGSGPQDRTG
ncbi:AtpZ/AtpI family protein [Arenibaculum sp.]|jgi:ATP synthase protein I|uniref:AtpZ/AtpI family protein n=1 Tax=Arenibaculum sp. TaxID=2865862 RepID=UPI002E13F4B2|nr:AtpZ/AtpI family protein [Arenibaculum sp.]